MLWKSFASVPIHVQLNDALFANFTAHVLQKEMIAITDLHFLSDVDVLVPECHGDHWYRLVALLGCVSVARVIGHVQYDPCRGRPFNFHEMDLCGGSEFSSCKKKKKNGGVFYRYQER